MSNDYELGDGTTVLPDEDVSCPDFRSSDNQTFSVAASDLGPRDAEPIDVCGQFKAERDEWRDLARRLAQVVQAREAVEGISFQDPPDTIAGIEAWTAHIRQLSQALQDARAAVTDDELARAAAPDDGGDDDDDPTD